MAIMIRAAWTIALAICLHSEDVVFASTISRRSMPLVGIDRMVDLTTRTVPTWIVLPKAGISAPLIVRSLQ